MTSHPTGANLGRKIVEMVGDTVVKARVATANLENDQRARFNHDYAEVLERELAPSMQSLFAHVLDIPDLPEPAREYFTTLMQPQHQANIWLQIAAVLGIGLSGPGAAAAGLLQRLQAESLKKWGDVKLTPQEAATAVVKGHLDRGLAGEQALLAGVHDDNFQVMIDTTGNPPGPETLITLLNRGKIDAATFLTGISEGLIANKWAEVLSTLRHGPISVADAIAAEVEGHTDANYAKQVMEYNGVDPASHDLLYETAGEPPGTQAMLELWNRGDVDQPTVEQAVRESRVKNKYIPAILKMARRLMPERTVVSAISKGVLTKEQGLQRLHMLGFNTEDAAALAGEASSTKMAKHKEIAEGQILKAYEDGSLDQNAAAAMIVKLGYDEQEAMFVLHLADHERDDKLAAVGVNKVRSLFVSHRITEGEASRALDSLSVPATMRNRLVHVWGLERDANVPTLTLAEWSSLVKKQIIDVPTFLSAMADKGYSDQHARYLLALTGVSLP